MIADKTWPTSSCNSREILRRSFSWAERSSDDRRFNSACAWRISLEADLAFPLQGEDPPQRRSGQRQPDTEREGEQQDEARAEVRKEIAHILAAGFELALGQRMHPVGEIDGEASARQYLVLNESSAPGVAALPRSTREQGSLCRDSPGLLS